MMVRRRLTAEEWDEAADLFEQGAAQAENSYERQRRLTIKLMNAASKRSNCNPDAMAALRAALSRQNVRVSDRD